MPTERGAKLGHLTPPLASKIPSIHIDLAVVVKATRPLMIISTIMLLLLSSFFFFLVDNHTRQYSFQKLFLKLMVQIPTTSILSSIIVNNNCTRKLILISSPWSSPSFSCYIEFCIDPCMEPFEKCFIKFELNRCNRGVGPNHSNSICLEHNIRLLPPSFHDAQGIISPRPLKYKIYNKKVL